MMAKVHEFQVRGGQEADRGRPEWPDQVSLVLAQDDAWELVSTLLAELRETSFGEIRCILNGRLKTLQE